MDCGLTLIQWLLGILGTKFNMNNPTLGYEDDKEISKIEIARIQLVEAINFFIQGKNICAVTLAGAAEAIFSGYLSVNGLTSAVEDATSSIELIRNKFNSNGNLLKPMQGKTNREIYNLWNDARNNFKHHGKNDDIKITVNAFDESYWMIKRALTNAKKSNVTIENENEFENWIIVNINS